MPISDFSDQTDIYKFTLYSKNNPKPSKKKHSHWWIALLAVGGVIALGLIIIFIIKYRRNKSKTGDDSK